MIIVSKEKFINWLKKKEYKDWTKTGFPSTIPEYVYWIERVMEQESINSWSELTDKIQCFLKVYGKHGKKEKFGGKNHFVVINALNRFMEYLLNECGFVPKSEIWFA